MLLGVSGRRPANRVGFGRFTVISLAEGESTLT